MGTKQTLELFALFGNILLGIFGLLFSRNSSSARTKTIPVLIGVYIVLSSAGLAFDYVLFGTATYLERISNPVLIAVFAYVVAIEIPGFLILGAYDSDATDVLRQLRAAVLSLKLKFDESLRELKVACDTHVTLLEETNLDQIVTYFIESCNRMQNVDGSLFGLVLGELDGQIHSISSRSKHPFPVLVQVLSLAGVSFLIAQILRGIFP